MSSVGSATSRRTKTAPRARRRLSPLLLWTAWILAGCGSADAVVAGLGGAQPGPESIPATVAAPGAPGAPSALLCDAATEQRAGGPVPDFAPMLAVVTHVELDEIQPELSIALSTLIGPRHLVERFSGPSPLVLGGWQPPGVPDDSLLWIRDYQPLFIRTADGGLKVVRYLADNPNRARYLPSLSEPHQRPLGGFRYFPAPGTVEDGRWLRTETVPLIHENGNLVSTGRLVFLTEFVFEQNELGSDEPHLRAAGYRARSRAEVLELLSRAVERPREDIVVLPPMPGEDTAHVDMFLLALDEHTVLVPTIPEASLAPEMLSEQTRGVAPLTRTFLDERAAELESLGLVVERLPMLPPMALSEDVITDDGEELEPGMLVLSPTNVLLVNVDRERAVLLPRFDVSAFPARFRRLDDAYRQRWAELFQRYGWTPISVDATQLALGQGLFRCASFPVPA